MRVGGFREKLGCEIALIQFDENIQKRDLLVGAFCCEFDGRMGVVDEGK